MAGLGLTMRLVAIPLAFVGGLQAASGNVLLGIVFLFAGVANFLAGERYSRQAVEPTNAR